MFGYHDFNRCKFDIWAPKAYHSCEDADEIQPGYGIWEETPFSCAIDNRAFSPYAKHTQEIDDLVEMIAAGGTSFELDDDFSEADLEELRRKLAARGLSADLSLS